jgi:hypothetical protein
MAKDRRVVGEIDGVAPAVDDDWRHRDSPLIGEQDTDSRLKKALVRYYARLPYLAKSPAAGASRAHPGVEKRRHRGCAWTTLAKAP